jgi:hypothetical protein
MEGSSYRILDMATPEGRAECDARSIFPPTFF